MPETSRSFQRVDRVPAVGREAAVAAARREATDAALAILEKGGNAVDAAVACGFVAAVVEPMDTCLAGSGFMLVHDPADGRAWSVDFPSRAPLAARPDMFRVQSGEGVSRLLGVSTVEHDANIEGPLACGVPATVGGLLAAHARFGRLPRADVLAPAVAAAHDGFAVDAYYTLQALDSAGRMNGRPEARRIFLDADGKPPIAPFLGSASLGTAPRLRQPELGATLERIADLGAPGFYEGPVAHAIAETCAELGGLISLEDLRHQRPVIAEPVRLDYRGHEILAPASPCGGWTELEILAVLRHFDVARLGADRLPVLVEAMRRAFLDRYHWLGDPEHVPVPLDALLSEPYTKELAGRIRDGEPAPWVDAAEGPPWEVLAFRAEQDPWPHDPEERSKPVFGPAPGGHPGQFAGHGTTHFSVIDRDGMTVSTTHTAANAFGCKVVVPGTGVLLDSSMAWFNATPGAANSIAPGKRPLANMGPLLVRWHGRPVLAVGAPGGRRIISAVTQVVSNVIDLGLDAQEAISAPRIDASGGAVLVSERIDAGDRDRLADRGHRVQIVPEQHEPFSYEMARPVACAVDGTRRTAAADPFTTAHTAAL
ncbi:gamma-glutamyltransferase [Actinomadura vinacea]|uniref:Gamma-glutamyltransferase n=1 Tax=Actinomadura vinacea TaxID=115336 RepID=A0ABP5VVD3_9ACTN